MKPRLPDLSRPRRWVHVNRHRLLGSVLLGAWFLLAVAAFLAFVFWLKDLL